MTLEPEHLYDAWEVDSRQSGRTDLLISSLPTDGKCVVVAHSLDMIHYIQDRIRRKNPSYPLKNTKWISARSDQNIHEKTRGLDLPVYIDHVVFYMLGQSFLNRINRAYHAKRDAVHRQPDVWYGMNS